MSTSTQEIADLALQASVSTNRSAKCDGRSVTYSPGHRRRCRRGGGSPASIRSIKRWMTMYGTSLNTGPSYKRDGLRAGVEVMLVISYL